MLWLVSLLRAVRSWVRQIGGPAVAFLPASLATRRTKPVSYLLVCLAICPHAYVELTRLKSRQLAPTYRIIDYVDNEGKGNRVSEH